MAKKPTKPQFTNKNKQQLKQLNDLFTSAKSQKELASKLGTTPRTIQRWLKGEMKPKPEKIDAIQKLAGAYAPTFKNEEKKENFLKKRSTPQERKKNVEKAKKQYQKKKEEKEQEKKLPPQEITMPIEEYINTYMKDYDKFAGLLNDMIYSRGIRYAKFWSENPEQAWFVRSPDEQVNKGNPFITMIGISSGYPHTEESEQLFIKRMVNVYTTDTTPLPSAIHTMDKLYYMGKGGKNHNEHVKKFTAYFYDNIDHLKTDKEKTKKANRKR